MKILAPPMKIPPAVKGAESLVEGVGVLIFVLLLVRRVLLLVDTTWSRMFWAVLLEGIATWMILLVVVKISAPPRSLLEPQPTGPRRPSSPPPQ